MAVYYKFKSAKDYDSIAIDGHFISVAILKEKIFESKHLGRGTDFDLVVTNAQTNEEYLDEDMLVPKNTSVLIRRVPGRPRMTIVTEPVSQQDEPKFENIPDDAQHATSGLIGADSSNVRMPDDSEWDEFGNDLYAIPEVMPIQPTNLVHDAPAPSKADEDSKIKALIDTPALDWQRQASDGFGAGRGFGRGMGGRMMGGRGFGRGGGGGAGGGLERKTPPQGYTCHRCKVPGHFIQHCPTNGDPNFDIKRVKPPTGIPKSMLMATPDGSYALPSGAVAVLKPNEAAFEKEIEGMPSTRSVGDLPPELHCPLCKEVMKDAVLTSKCCFNSFCDKCIRDHIIAKSMCICGATNVLADDLLPNKTLRDTINRILESNNSSAENGGSVFHVQDMESARCPPPKIPSPTQSAASKGEPMPMPVPLPVPHIEETAQVKEIPEVHQATSNAPSQSLGRDKVTKVADVSETTRGSMTVKEPVSRGGAPPVADDEVQQKLVPGEAAKKKKKKKVHLPYNAAEMHWKMTEDIAAENYMMSMGPSYNPYWNGMAPGMEAYMNPYANAMPYMGYGLGPMDVPYGGVLPGPDPFAAQGYMMPYVRPPQRDLSDFGMGMNAGAPIMSREEFEARKADLRMRREMERRGETREMAKDREFSREVSGGGGGGGGADVKSKSKAAVYPSSNTAHHHHQHQHHNQQQRPRQQERPSPDRPARDLDPPNHHQHRPSSNKRKSDHESHPQQHRSHHRTESSSAPRPQQTLDQPPPPSSKSSSSATAAAMAAAAAAADRKHKASVFSRISYPEEEAAAAAASKKRKHVSSSSEAPVGAPTGSSGQYRTSSTGGYHEDYRPTSSVSRKSAAVEYESSDDDRHFKRRPARMESSPPAPAPEEEARQSRGSRERERERERERREERERGGGGGYSKHR